MIIAEVGINHDGNLEKAIAMIDAAYDAGCRWVKFQIHVPEDEMLINDIVPSNAKESIWSLIKRCAMTEEEDKILKNYCDNMGMNYLATPFSREAVDRLKRMGVSLIKVGSGECNNYPLLRYIKQKNMRVILSTGMNGRKEVDKAFHILGINLRCILHCVSEYPTPYERVNLYRMLDIKEWFKYYSHKPRVGLSDHTPDLYTSFAAIALGADIIEKHFTLNKGWDGPDIPISIDPTELKMLVEGEKAIKQAMKYQEPKDEGTKKFAFHSVVTLKEIKKGEKFTEENLWVKRPGGGIPAEEYESILGKTAVENIPANVPLQRDEYA